MYVSKCEYCGKEKEYKYKSQIKRFCSHKCSNNYKWENIRQRAEYIILNCPMCNKQIKIYKNDWRIKHSKKIYCSKKCSINASKKGALQKCQYCGNEFYTTRNKFCSKKCATEYKKEHYNHKIYLEGQYLAGYEKDYNKKGNYKVHRKIIEDLLGRKLNPNEIVHHKDENKLNNKLSNLKIMSRAEHSRYHRLKEIENGKKLFGR